MAIEYRRREQELDSNLYAHWKPDVILRRNERNRVIATMLHRAGVFPGEGDRCLEIGFGALGWLGELLCWGVREPDLHGIEIDHDRLRRAQAALPCADLRLGDGARLPWKDNQFHLVVASTVFTSILDSRVRSIVSGEITRVLAPGGALLWYDFRVNNPRNRQVRGVSRREIRSLFPQLHGRIRSLTLAPPLARLLANKSWMLASLGSAIPILHTHLAAVLIKRRRDSEETDQVFDTVSVR
jgi:hypothetical protein